MVINQPRAPSYTGGGSGGAEPFDDFGQKLDGRIAERNTQVTAFNEHMPLASRDFLVFYAS